MDNKQKIENLVSDTLSSLDHVKRAQSNPFLYTRIMARLQQDDGAWSRVAYYLTRPAFAAAVLVAVILMNSAIFFQRTDTATPSEDDQVFATEYSNLTQPADEGLLYNDDQP